MLTEETLIPTVSGMATGTGGMGNTCSGHG